MAKNGYDISSSGTSIVGLVAGIANGKIEVTAEYDFPPKLEGIEGEVDRGQLPIELRQLRVIQMDTVKEIASLERKLAAAKQRFVSVSDLFRDGVHEHYPVSMVVTGSSTEMRAEGGQALYFGPNFNVYSAPIKAAKAAKLRVELEQRKKDAVRRDERRGDSRHSGFEVFGLDDPEVPKEIKDMVESLLGGSDGLGLRGSSLGPLGDILGRMMGGEPDAFGLGRERPRAARG